MIATISAALNSVLQAIPAPLLDKIIAGIRVALIVAIGLPLLRFGVYRIYNSLAKRGSPQAAFFIRSVLYYGGLAIIVAMVLNNLGFQLGALLGAAGVAGVAIGFAAQTSLSNMISGLFIIGERPFAVGDIIEVGSNKGTVASIDLLSVKLRTFDNRLVRIPSEMLLKQEVTNVTGFPIRRFEVTIGVAYHEDIDHVIAVLKDIIRDNPFALDEPEPLVQFINFGDSSLDIMIGVWIAREDFVKLRGTLLPAIKRRFDQEKIEIPFPHRTLYAGTATAPLPVRVTNEPANK